MKVMVVGGGGREHAVIKKLRQNPEIAEIFALPGNGGIAEDARCVPIGAKDIPSIVDFAVNNSIGFAIVAPDDPLVLGAVDALEAAGIPCFGPNAAAAEIEGSKIFSKNLMKKYGIPTACYETFSEEAPAVKYLNECSFPIVIKADGLALGKGVVIAESLIEALSAVRSMMRDRVFGESGSRVVVEEYLQGPEVSVLAFTDGKTIVPMVSSMDHKRAKTGDTGKNTGGMGTIAPNPFYTEEIAAKCMEGIFLPTMNAMNAEGRKFKGCLYFGLMLTGDGPKVIEYNCRFGDPEAQVVLPLLKTDLFSVMRAVSEERLGKIKTEFSKGAACCVIIASGGYPEKYETGYEISMPSIPEGVFIFHAGTRLDDQGALRTSGGRVLGVTATGDSLRAAVAKAYETAERVSFTGAYYRADIGKRALEQIERS